MGNKGMIIGFMGQELDDTLKRKIEAAVETAIENYEVTDFYFKNEVEMDDLDIEDNATLKNLEHNYSKVNEFIIEKIKEYREAHKEKNIHTAILVAREADENYNKDLYDEIIQSYYIFYSELESAISYDAYTLRDDFLMSNVNYIFWIANKILINKSIKFDKVVFVD